MRGLALSLACVVVVACAPARRTWQPQPLPPGAAAPAAYAVLSLSTPLSIAPREDAPVVWQISPQRIYSGTSAPRFGVFQMIGQERAWVALETLGRAPSLHCAGGMPALEPFRLRFFVPASALVPITQREVRHTFPDGTLFELGRGVPLEPLAQRGLFRAHLGSMHAIVELAGPDVGTRYLPSNELPRAAAMRVLRGDVIAASVPVLGGGSGRVGASAAEDVPVYAEAARGGESVVELRPPCARLVVRVPAHAVSDAGGAMGGVIASGESAEGALVRSGTRVVWRDGREAGTVTRDVILGREIEPARALRCFLHAVRTEETADPSADLELCFDRRSVASPGAGPARLLDPPG